MKKSEIIRNSLVGLKNFPKQFPAHIWDQEFSGEDEQVFIEAVRQIRSRSEWFPTYAEVKGVMREIQLRNIMKAKEVESASHELSDVERSHGRAAAEIFKKWYKWLRTYDHPTPEIRAKYYRGCAMDYKELGGDGEFMEGVDTLFLRAEEIETQMEAV